MIARAAVPQARDAALQDLAADGVDDEIHADATGELAHVRDPVGIGVVDAVVEAERRRGAPSRSSLDAVASTVAPGPLRELDGRDADTTRAGLDEHRLALGEVTELEQAVVRGAERDRDARARDDIRRRRESAT